MRFTEIAFWREVRLDDLWVPGNDGRTPYLHKLAAPEWTITRDAGEPVYVVQRGQGPLIEVPADNVRYARREAAQVAKGGKRG
jgi:hypothetical protein